MSERAAAPEHPLPRHTRTVCTHAPTPLASPPPRTSNRYTNTAAVISRISYIDGDKGILRYRGYPIEELAARSNMMEVAYLVLFGNLPTQPQLAVFKEVSRAATHPSQRWR